MDRLIQVSPAFWNVRGTFRIAGLLNIGTQMSLVQRPDGRFLLLDACDMDDAIAARVDGLTGGGAAIDAVLHLHPFHTVYVAALHARYPQAKLFGTARHRRLNPELPWQRPNTDDPALHAEFADVLDFSVPAGVDFISANEHVHFSSVLAYHRPSTTMHVNDTIMYLRYPRLLRMFGRSDSLSFHMTLSKALEKRPGAAAEFRAWATGLASNWGDARNLCAAHTSTLRSETAGGPSIAARLSDALARCDRMLRRHEQRYG